MSIGYFQLAVSYHRVGEYYQAVKNYEATLQVHSALELSYLLSF